MKLVLSAFLYFFSVAAIACTWTSDCQTGYQCNSTTHVCTQGAWPNGGCTWDSDCLPGYGCSNKSCVKEGGTNFECTWDSDCLAGYHCNSSSHSCVMGSWPNGGCTWDSDCLSGYECENKTCIPTGPVDDDNRVSRSATSLAVIHQILKAAGSMSTPENCK